MSVEVKNINDKEMKIRLMILACSMLLAMSIAAAPVADTLRVQFRLRQHEVDPAYAGNGKRMDAFIDHLRQCVKAEAANPDPAAAATELCIRIYAGASPDGPAALNRRLGEQRGQAIRQAVMDRLALEDMDQQVGYVVVVNEGARWQQLETMVAASGESWRDEVLEVLRRERYDEADEDKQDPRETELRLLRGGLVWEELMSNYMPALRSVGSAVVMRVPKMMRMAQQGVRDTLVIRDTVYYMPYGQEGEALESLRSLMNSKTLKTHKKKEEKAPVPLRTGRAFALKTNLLFLGTGTPNAQVEWWLGRRWSVQIEALCAWWTLAHGAYANQLLYGGMEMRHWLGNRQKHSTIDGWYIGLGGGAGLYDLGWKSRGFQGEAALGYLALGWQHRFGQRRQWCVDLGIGAGVFMTRYKEYRGSSVSPEGHEEKYDDYLMWQKNGHLTWPGCTHASISIGYCFGK